MTLWVTRSYPRYEHRRFSTPTYQRKKNYRPKTRVLAPPKLFEDRASEEPVLPDPNTLCPYCDVPLPQNPSPTLLRLLDEAASKSYADARPDNALGQMADTPIRAPICAQHVFERDLIPKARSSGWPTEINFRQVEQRVRSHHQAFKTLLEDPEGLVDIFAKCQGLGGNISNYHLIQTGYYGEQGLQIIDETLRRLLTIASESTAPLTPAQFASWVLVPEAAVLLIMEDLQVEKERAVNIMLESSTYGVFMFPAQD
ncbi:RTC4-like domain-containing protein [Mycena galopus ATCC 62051]|nr:RTC4-like domain-containing protein [Mycena galopus ATCC 62051]